MRGSHYQRVLICGLILASVLGCALKRRSSLEPQVIRYHQSYKWKDYTQASHYVADPEEFLKKRELLGDKLEIIDFDIVRTTFNRNGWEAEVEVMRTYHILPSVVVARQRIVQLWKYDPKKKNWLLISPY